MSPSPSSDLVVGLDLGSSAAKSTVFTLEGTAVASSRTTYEPRLGASGMAEYDPSELRAASLRSLADALQGVDPRRVQAVAIDAMMSGAIAVDADGEPLVAYTTTLDTRFSAYLDAYLREHGPAVRELSGSGQATLGPKLQWIRRQYPEIAGRIAKFTLAGDFIARFLTGASAADAFIDPTYLWTTGLADTANLRWSPELMQAAGVDEGQLPRIVAPSDVVGGISERVASVTGLLSGCPVVAGCGDQAAGYLGAGVSRVGRAGDSSGTYSVFAGVCAEFTPSPEPAAPDVVASAVAGLFHPQTMVIGGGMTRDWVCHILGGWRGAVPELESLAAESPVGADGIIFVPHLGGQGYPARPTMRGSWLGLNWAHTPGDMYRAALEAIALDQLASMTRLLQIHSDTSIDQVTVYGGGAKSPVWTQIKCDALGIPYVSLGDENPASLGVALLAAEGVGLIESAATRAAELARPLQVYEPDEGNHARYADLLPRYLEAVETEARRSSSTQVT